jgi:hypothetical protein
MVADRNAPVARGPTAFRLPKKLCPICGAAQDADRQFCSCGHGFAGDSYLSWEDDAAEPARNQHAANNQVRPASAGCAPLLFFGFGLAIAGGIVGAIIGDAVEGNPIMMKGLLAKMFAVAGAALGFLIGVVLVAIRKNAARP